MSMQILQSGQMVAISGGAGTTTLMLGEVPMRESQGSYNLDRVTVIAPSTVTGNGLGTINIRQMRAAVQVAASIATLLLASAVNLTAETPVSVPVTGTPILLPGDLLEVTYVQTGGGLALPAGTIVKVEIS